MNKKDAISRVLETHNYEIEDVVETVTIPKNAYEQLLKDQDWLFCLEAAGVDNWEGMEIAIDYFRKSKYADIE